MVLTATVTMKCTEKVSVENEFLFTNYLFYSKIILEEVTFPESYF